MRKIRLDEDTSYKVYCFRNHADVVCNSIVTYLNDLLKYRGWIYLVDIYNEFGVRWYPNSDNPIYRYDDAKTLLTLEDVCSDHAYLIINE